MQGFDEELKFLNIYAPYKERKALWENMDFSGLLNLKNLVIVRDLNFSMNTYESWGMVTSLDPLDDFFKNYST